jgi:hypothetical protein
MKLLLPLSLTLLFLGTSLKSFASYCTYEQMVEDLNRVSASSRMFSFQCTYPPRTTTYGNCLLDFDNREVEVTQTLDSPTGVGTYWMEGYFIKTVPSFQINPVIVAILKCR